MNGSVWTSTLPELGGSVRLRGLESPVDVLRDALGVPHIRAGSTHDVFFAQGFVHAQDRLWHMEYDRRRAAGTLAELLGPEAVAQDAFARRMGLAASARDDYASFDAETRGVLEAYASGVNAFIATGPLPAELTLLGEAPEPWEPWHAGAVFKVRHVLMGPHDPKLWRARLLRTLGPQVAHLVGTAHGREDTVIAPVGGTAVAHIEPEDLLRGAPGVGELRPVDLGSGELGEGSNNWVVHGSRTASGLPLLAGDSHRTLEVPNVYYQNHIACPAFDAIGLSFPGVPAMPHFGHNAHAAWCITHAMADTQDLWVERFDSAGRYAFGDTWHTPERRTETIGVRDGRPVGVDVTVTRHGPVVLGDPGTGAAIAMRWTGTDGPNPTLCALLPMLLAESVGALEECMRTWVDPCNSLLTADVHGSIGYLHRGRVPVRSRANGLAPVPGWTGEHEWHGDVPFSELPRLRDPETGFIATANNRARGDDYPHYLGTDYTAPSRVRRVLARLADLSGATAEDMAEIHADRLAIPAAAFIEAAGRITTLSGRAAEARDLLAAWDGRMDPDASAPCVYAALRLALATVARERGPLGRVPEPSSAEPDPTPTATRIGRVLPRLLASGDASLLGGEPDDLVAKALTRAAAQLTDTLGPDPGAWRWRDVHRTEIVHPLTSVFPELAGTLDPPAVGLGGDADTVLCATAELDLGVEHASVVRYVFDLRDWDRSGWIVPLGVSGHPASPHYADQAADWSDVRLQPMTYSWERIAAEAETRQTLEPPSDR